MTTIAAPALQTLRSPLRLSTLKSERRTPEPRDPDHGERSLRAPALDAANNRLFISDDDLCQVFCVDLADPTKVLWQFDTLALGALDPEDVAFAPASDGSGETSLYIADYGWSHADDGRMLEIDLGDQQGPEGSWLLS